VFVFAAAALAIAQPAPPYLCGPDCTQPGRYVLCRDSFDDNSMSAGGVQLTDFLDSACVTFDPPAPMFALTGFAALFGSGDMLIGLIEIFEENNVAAPGNRVGESGAGIPSSNSNGFSGLFFGAINLTASFRLCMRQQLDDPVGTMLVRPMLFDGDGVQGQNWSYNAPTWADANGAYSGDLVFRAVVEYDDLTPWEVGGPCYMTQTDGGVPADSGTGNDPDGGGNNDPDGGGNSDLDGGVDGGGNNDNPPPTITAITPNQGPNTQTTSVIASGTGFVAGLTLKIGTIPTDGVDVSGSTTINAIVPANIAGGVYDVVVQNPDGQAAILPQAYTVLVPNQPPPGGKADTCGCDHTTSGRAPLWLLALLFLRPNRDRSRRRREDQRE
jgi:hypothetical protein